MKVVSLACLIALSVLLCARPVAARTSPKTAAEADSLYRRACARAVDPALDQRRAALDDFEEASRLAPDRADILIAFGQACLASGQYSRARTQLKRAAQLTPDDPDAWSALGLGWRHDWLTTLERGSLDESARCFERAGACAPNRADVWASASAIQLLRGRTREALQDAHRARSADPSAAEPLLAIGAVFYRMSLLAYADSAFRAARDRLPPELARRFDELPYDAHPRPAWPDHVSAGRVEAMDTAAAPTQDSWAEYDPDLTTAENEAQLDYWTRLALVMFLFRYGDRVRWDMRADLILRYGLPSAIAFNPIGAQLGDRELEYQYQRFVPNAWAPPPLPYAYNMQMWHYPELGMSVTLIDRGLSEDYELPPNDYYDPDPRPNPAMLAVRSDLMALGSGRGVVRTMAPAAQPLAVSAAVTRYPLADGTRLLAHVSAQGERADSMWSAWAVVAEDGQVVARASAPMLISACDPTAYQVGEFASSLPPGNYRVDVSVRGPRGGHGLAHLLTRIDPPATQLEMSDLVLACGNEMTSVGREGVRVEPDMQRTVSGGTLVAYYELEHLVPDPGGIAHFLYRYTIRPKPVVEGAATPPPVVDAWRQEEYAGTHRRQFVSIALPNLSPGMYELTIEVDDVVSGNHVEDSLNFTRVR